MRTDTGPAGRFQGFFEHLELELMVEAGLTPMQAIVSATGTAAGCWGKQGALGAITRGAQADLIVLARNPLDNIVNTRADTARRNRRLRRRSCRIMAARSWLPDHGRAT